MEREFWEQALARAVTDFRFRARLLADPGDALLEYALDGSAVPLPAPVPSAASLGQVAGFLLRLSASHGDDGEPEVAGNVTRIADYRSASGSGSARRRSCARTQGVCKDARLLPFPGVGSVVSDPAAPHEVASALGD